MPQPQLTHDPAAPPAGAETPNAARIYNCLTGGDANFVADRRAAAHLTTAVPGIVADAQANRAFLARAVRYLAGQGVQQFLDLGAGLPATGSVHEVARQIDPVARVVYVDHDPTVVEAWRHALGDTERIGVLHADIRNPSDVLASAEVLDLLDLTKPVGLLAAAVLHYVSDAHEPAALLGAYRAALTPGSYLVLSHAAWENLRVGQYINVAGVYERALAPLTLRSPQEISALMHGWSLIPPVEGTTPAIAPVGEWRWADDLTEPDSDARILLGGVGRLGAPASDG